MSAPALCLSCRRRLDTLPHPALVLSQNEAAVLRRVLGVNVRKGDAFCNGECALVGIYTAYLRRLKGQG